LVRTRQFLGGLGGFPSLLIGLLVAAVFWVAAWRYVMPQMIGARYEWRGWALWGDALSCLGINASIAVISAFMAAVVGVIGLALGGSMLGFFGAVPGLLIALLVVIPSLFGVPAIWLYLRRKWRYTDWPGKDTSFRRVVAAYIVVALAANVTYLVFIVGYTAMIGIL
jgi:hypothetical protein